ncbi:MAG: Fe-S-containing hydro-lyase [Thermovirgaceae bacterium]
MEALSLTTPLDTETVRNLQAGDSVLLNGVIYTARDAAHQRLVESADAGRPLPFPIRGQVLYYVGPAPAPPGWAVGPAGPTTSGRMDPYTPRLLELGLKGMIGKGSRSAGVIEAMKRHDAVYFGAVGGAAALVAKSVTGVEIVAYEDLGPEAVYRFTVSHLPLTVLIDCQGRNLYVTGPEKYHRQNQA